jgi:hypothetical protein
MKKEAECGEVLGTHYNRTDKAAKAEVTIEQVNGTDGCKGVTVKIYDATSADPLGSYYREEAGGPDLYEVPANGRLEVCCGEIIALDGRHGKCTATWTLHWVC